MIVFVDRDNLTKIIGCNLPSSSRDNSPGNSPPSITSTELPCTCVALRGSGVVMFTRNSSATIEQPAETTALPFAISFYPEPSEAVIATANLFDPTIGLAATTFAMQSVSHTYTAFAPTNPAKDVSATTIRPQLGDIPCADSLTSSNMT